MNQYEKKYNNLIFEWKVLHPITKEQLKLENQYGEVHHIKPISLFNALKDDENNKVVLPYIQHVLAHKYLALWYLEEYGEYDSRTKAMLYAIWRMMHTKRTINEDTIDVQKIIKLDCKQIAEFEKIRGAYSKIATSNGKNHKLTDIGRQKLKMPKSAEHRCKIAMALKHKQKSKQHRKALSIAAKKTAQNTIFVNNGVVNKRVPANAIPEGFTIGRLQPKGFIWINNGTKQMRWFQSDIPNGYVKGRLKSISKV